MKNLVQYVLLTAMCLAAAPSIAVGDTLFIRVHFLYGSKPKKKFRHIENKWFGGVLGGHAGVEIDKNKILNFGPTAMFHVFSHPKIINSRYFIHDTVSFYQVHSTKGDSMKRTIITIPVSSRQKEKLDSLARVYLENTPYDYAFFGMRCGAAAYDVLSQAGIVKKHSFGRTWRKIFYPRKLRRRLERNAREKGYSIRRTPGTYRRIWEKD